MAQARSDAAAALARIDWSKDDIVLWVPGTDGTDFMEKFREGFEKAWMGQSMTAVSMNYHGTWKLDTSEPTGEATLRLVLAGIAAHGGHHRLLLAGLSQGAWMIGDVLADPAMRRVVTRAAIFGHPQVSLHHYDDGHDPAIREYDHPKDIIAMAIHGPRVQAIDAMQALYTGNIVPNLGVIVAAVAASPQVGLTAIANMLRDRHLLPKAKIDWHNYDDEYVQGAQWLHDAPPLVQGASQACNGAALGTPHRR